MANPVGAIVLAAFEPDVELFRRQLQSIRDQSVRDWICVVAVDGEVAPVAGAVRGAVGDDPRFRVVGDGTRLGFYLNFERGLREVPPGTEWVALSDQDDVWSPDKLARLLPSLGHASLVSGQARLVEHPSGRTLGTTARRGRGMAMTVLNNQYTGSLCVLRASLLSAALPFPRISTRAAAHDHWLAVVAEAADGALTLDVVVQDYVQHAANVFGDPSREERGIRARLANVRRFADRYEGSHSLPALLRMLFWVFVGWRQLMVQTLAAREPGKVPATVLRAFGPGRRFAVAMRMLRAARSEGYVPSAFVVSYVASWVAGILIRGRRRPPTT